MPPGFKNALNIENDRKRKIKDCECVCVCVCRNISEHNILIGQAEFSWMKLHVALWVRKRILYLRAAGLFWQVPQHAPELKEASSRTPDPPSHTREPVYGAHTAHTAF